jgi:hypothetical protein
MKPDVDAAAWIPGRPAHDRHEPLVLLSEDLIAIGLGAEFVV